MPDQQNAVDKGLIVAALFAIVTDWDKTEVRTGRRGEYRTTGASMHRLRELNPDEAEQVTMICGALGLDTNQEDCTELFNGEYEYQVSFACNRFQTKSGIRGDGPQLTTQELRTLERAKQILGDKEFAATRFMTRRDERKAA